MYRKPFKMDKEAELTKGLLRNLPIWEELDYSRASVRKLTRELNIFINRQTKRFERLEQLPELNTNNVARIISQSLDPEYSNDTRVYKKINGVYVHKDNDLNTDDNEGRVECLRILSSPICTDEEVFAMLKPNEPWVKCKVVVVLHNPKHKKQNEFTTTFRLRYNTRTFLVSKYAVARIQDLRNKLEPPKRVVAGHNMDNLMPGTICYEPFEWSLNRYLVIMDDGSAEYFKHDHIFPIVGQSPYPWVDSRFLDSKNRLNELYLLDFLMNYPNRFLLHASIGQDCKVFRNGLLSSAKIIGLDCDLAKVKYVDGSEESIYRGSIRFRQKDHRAMSEKLSKYRVNASLEDRFYCQIVINCKSYHDVGCRATSEDILKFTEDFGEVIVSRFGQSSSNRPGSASPERVDVVLDPIDGDLQSDQDSDESSSSLSKNHKCSPECLEVRGSRTESSVRDFTSEFRDVSDLKVPLLLGWKRDIIKRYSKNGSPQMRVVYESPCGKKFKVIYYLSNYLDRTKSKLDVDYFSFSQKVDLKKTIPPMKAFYFVDNIAIDKDSKLPLERKNISAINYFSEEELPSDFIYRNECFPHPKLVQDGFNLNTDFKSGCDCKDDCDQTASCACHQLNEQAYFRRPSDKSEPMFFYKYKRLPKLVHTGIFECNSLCKCSSKCKNRVVQNGIRFRLQVAKTLKKGWGVITLDDIPEGSFICTYSAEILDDANAHGDDDMYFADLDYVTVNENRKLGFESDTDTGVDTNDSDDSEIKPKRSKKRLVLGSDSDESSDKQNKNQSNRRTIRNTARKSSTPSKRTYEIRKTRQKYRKFHDILKSHDYTLDARMSGNIGRFCNHSCDPNAFVQNVFIETHDLRFPVVGIFSCRAIKAYEEIVWDYHYAVGSIPGRVIMCNCGSSNCKGRIL